MIIKKVLNLKEVKHDLLRGAKCLNLALCDSQLFVTVLPISYSYNTHNTVYSIVNTHNTI